MKSEADHIELRSEEVQEILGTPPGWLARWGTLAALIGVVALGWLGFWIEMPQTLEADVKITSKDPPRRFYAPSTTVLNDIIFGNESKVDSGATILHFNSKARLAHVLSLETELLQVENDTQILAMNIRRDLVLGELQEDYYDFLEKWDQYHFVSNRPTDNGGRSESAARIRDLESEIRELRIRLESLQNQLSEAQTRYDKELTLLNKGVLTREELNPTRIERDSYERQVQDAQSSIRSKSNQISMLRDRSRSNSGRAKALEDQSAAFGLLKDSFARLRNQVSEWKREYTVESPISGTVLFAKDNLAKGQFVQRDSLLLVIVPGKASGTVAKMEIVPEEAGQIVKGQKVQIKLYDYPFPEYGAVWGKVEGKGKLPTGGKIPVEVRFPGDSLVATKAGLIQPEGEMRGKATIILSRRRLIQRIFGIGEG